MSWWWEPGKVGCCICFRSFFVEELNVNDKGEPEDVCKECASEERTRSEKRQTRT